MSLPKAILWDMDGVLADTSQLHFETWEHIFSGYGIPFDRQKFHQIYGLKNSDFLPFLAGEPLELKFIDRIANEKEVAFRHLLPGRVVAFPGVLDWLGRFKAWGLKQAVASSAPPENIEAVVDELGIRHYFDALVNPGDQPGKPHPAVFLKASQVLGIPPGHCVVIEDSLPGLKAAHNAGMRCIAVANTNPPGALAQADLVVESLAQLQVSQVEALL